MGGRFAEADPVAAAAVEALPAARLRPDVVIPLPPRVGIAGWLRRMAGVHGPDFAAARRRAWQLAVLAAILLIGRFAVVAPLQTWLAAAAVAVAGLAAVQVVAVECYWSAQRRFEVPWLEAQSRVLQTHWFEVLRCTLSGVSGSERPLHRVVDLTSPRDVADLMAFQTDPGAGSARLVVEFGCSGSAPGEVMVQTVDVHVARLRWATAGNVRRGGVQFPQARYHSDPADGSGRGQPSQRTFWVLGQAVLFAAAPAPAVQTGVSGSGPRLD